MGSTVHEGSGYPVGKVNTLNLYPLHFREFLAATGNQVLCNLIETGDADLINGFSGKFVPLLRQYYLSLIHICTTVRMFIDSGITWEDAMAMMQNVTLK